MGSIPQPSPVSGADAWRLHCRLLYRQRRPAAAAELPGSRSTRFDPRDRAGHRRALSDAARDHAPFRYLARPGDVVRVHGRDGLAHVDPDGRGGCGAGRDPASVGNALRRPADPDDGRTGSDARRREPRTSAGRGHQRTVMARTPRRRPGHRGTPRHIERRAVYDRRRDPARLCAAQASAARRIRDGHDRVRGDRAVPDIARQFRLDGAVQLRRRRTTEARRHTAAVTRRDERPSGHRRRNRSARRRERRQSSAAGSCRSRKRSSGRCAAGSSCSLGRGRASPHRLRKPCEPDADADDRPAAGISGALCSGREPLAARSRRHGRPGRPRRDRRRGRSRTRGGRVADLRHHRTDQPPARARGRDRRSRLSDSPGLFRFSQRSPLRCCRRGALDEATWSPSCAAAAARATAAHTVYGARS